MQTLAQRFTDEAQFSQDAVANLTSHFQFLAAAEAAFSGKPIEMLPHLPSTDTSSWLQVQNTPLHGCFEDLQHKLREYAQDLDAFEPRVKEFEHIVWVAVNQPDQLHFHVNVPAAGWEPDWMKAGIQDVANVGTGVATDAVTTALRPAIDFLQAHQTDIYTMLDQMRQGFETIFIPRTDPDVLQAHIDYLSAVKDAYDTHIRSPFVSATQPIAIHYKPPTGQDSYQVAWPTVADQQYHTSLALGNAITQLQQLQGTNELITMSTTSVVVAVGVFLVAIAVSAAIVTLIGTIPTMIVSGGDVVISVGAITINVTAIVTLLGGFLSTTFLGIAVWEIGAIVVIGTTVGVGAAWWNQQHPGQLQQWEEAIIIGVTTLFAKSSGHSGHAKGGNDDVKKSPKNMV